MAQKIAKSMKNGGETDKNESYCRFFILCIPKIEYLGRMQIIGLHEQKTENCEQKEPYERGCLVLRHPLLSFYETEIINRFRF